VQGRKIKPFCESSLPVSHLAEAYKDLAFVSTACRDRLGRLSKYSTRRENVCTRDIGLLASAVFGFTACASVSSFFKSADSSLPIETVDASSGQIVSARAFETSDRLYVAGQMQKLFGYTVPPAAHVDIQLINGDRGIIAEKQDSIREVSPREQNARNRLYSYVASFPLEIARQATSIRVTYSPFSHKDHLDPSARASAGNLRFREHVRQRI
jgi:hypothetical protein